MRILKRLFHRPPPSISREQALSIAQQECKQRGWTWIEPITITQRFGAWYIRTNADKRGINAVLIIDQADGHVHHAGFNPR